MKKKYFFTVLAIGMTAFIFWNSAQPALVSAASSGRIVAIISKLLSYMGVRVNDDIMQVIVRKSAHIAEFGVQAILIALSFTGKYRKRIVYILFFGLLTACIDEYIQLFSEGRSGAVLDVFIDFAGTVGGAVLCGIFRRRKKIRI